MQPRERLLLGLVAVLAGGWLADAALLQPGLAWFERTRTAARKAGEEAALARALVDRQGRIQADWRARHAAGLLDDEATARFRLQRAIADAARSGGVALDSVSGGQLIAAARDESCDTLRLTVTGQGSLAQILACTGAMAAAAQPLAIERCELAAGDARKDLLEMSLTLSTRIAAAAQRGGRAIPADATAWTPAPAGAGAAEAIVAARPFLADRRTTTRPVEAASAAPAAAPAGGWAVVGVVARADGAVAFLRHLGDGRERQLTVGEEVDGESASAVDAGGVVLGQGDTARRVAIGTQFDGSPIPGGRAATPATAPRAPSGGTATPLSDPGREAILERLRQQRNKTP